MDAKPTGIHFASAISSSWGLISEDSGFSRHTKYRSDLFNAINELTLRGSRWIYVVILLTFQMRQYYVVWNTTSVWIPFLRLFPLQLRVLRQDERPHRDPRFLCRKDKALGTTNMHRYICIRYCASITSGHLPEVGVTAVLFLDH